MDRGVVLLDTIWSPLSTPHLLLWLMPREALHVWYGIATLCRATSFRISDMLQSHNLLTSCEASPSVWRASFLALAQIRRYLYVLQLWKVKHVVVGGWAIFEWQRRHQGNGKLAGDFHITTVEIAFFKSLLHTHARKALSRSGREFRSRGMTSSSSAS